MILSGYLTTDLVAGGGSDRRSSMRSAVIDTRLRTAEDAVAALVEVWRTGTDDPTEQAWDEMEGPAREAIDALSSLLGAIDLARAGGGAVPARDVRQVPAPRPPA